MKMFKQFLLLLLLMAQSQIFGMEEDMLSLHKAVLANDLDRVMFLVKSGVDIHKKDGAFKTAFDYAIADKNCKKIAAYLYPCYFDLANLEETIGYKFKKVRRLVKAFTPRTVNFHRNYETYEWLGDAILHEVLTKILYSGAYDKVDEGLLTNARMILEQKETLAELSERLGFDKYIINGKKAVTIDMLEDAVESVIAAIYKDGGAEAAQIFIHRFWTPMINDSKKLPMSPIIILDQWRRLNNKKLKEFWREESTGFKYKITCDKLEVFGCSAYKRIAHYYAAKNFILSLPATYQNYKDMLLISPLSTEYQVVGEDLECCIDTSSWESEQIIFPFAYNLYMISQMLDYPRPIFETTKSGVDHNPTFVSTVTFGGFNVTGGEAKTKKKAKERVSKLAFNQWKKNLMSSLGIATAHKINIKKLIFLEIVRSKIDAGKQSKVLLKELLDKLELEKATFEDHLVGGNTKNTDCYKFYSTVTCPGILKKTIKGDKCVSIKEAQENVASLVFQKSIEKIKKNLSQSNDL